MGVVFAGLPESSVDYRASCDFLQALSSKPCGATAEERTQAAVVAMHTASFAYGRLDPTL